MSSDSSFDFHVTVENEDSLGERLWCELMEYELGGKRPSDLVQICCDDGVEKLAHQSALRISSDYFKEILVDGSKARIKLDVSSKIVDLILEYIYGRQDFRIGASSIIPLFAAAKKLRIRTLAQTLPTCLEQDHYEKLIDNQEAFIEINDHDMKVVGEFFSNAGITLTYQNKLVRNLLRWKDLGENRSEIAFELMGSSLNTELTKPHPGTTRAIQKPLVEKGNSDHCFYLLPPTREKPFYEIVELSANDEFVHESYRKFQHPFYDSSILGRVLHGDLLYELSPLNLTVFRLPTEKNGKTGSVPIEEVSRTVHSDSRGMLSSKGCIYIWGTLNVYRIELINREIAYNLFCETDSEIERVFPLNPEDDSHPSLAVVLKPEPHKLHFYSSRGRISGCLELKTTSHNPYGGVTYTKTVDKFLLVSDSEIVGLYQGKVVWYSHTFGTATKKENNHPIEKYWRVISKRKTIWVSSPGCIHVRRNDVWKTCEDFVGLVKFIDVI